MHDARRDPNLALYASIDPPGRVLDVVALTSDENLLTALRDASDGKHAFWRAATAEAAVDLLVGGRCCILIADLTALRGGEAAAFFERLHAQFPELVLMAAGRREQARGEVGALISAGVVYRLLHKPVSPARAASFMTAASRRYHELRRLAPLGAGFARTASARRRAGSIALAALAACTLLIAAFALWRSVRPTPPAESAVAAQPSTEHIALLLGRAQLAYARDQLDAPRGDNALELYRAVLELEPHNAAASAGLARVVGALEARVVAALKARDAPQGLKALTSLQRAQAAHPRLDALRQELIALSRSAAATPTPGER